MSSVITRTIPAGGSLEYASLPNGEPIRGIIIDNASGSWLFVVSEKTFVPPYTKGWSLALSFSQNAITVRSQDGPSGQQSTTAGDPWIIQLSTDPGITSPGYPYVTRQGQPEWLTFSTGLVVTTAGIANVSTTILGGDHTKRIRVMQVICEGDIFNAKRIGCPVFMQLLSSLFHVIDAKVDANHDPIVSTFAPPLDLPVGEEMTLLAWLINWSAGDQETVNLNVIYQVV